MVVKRLEAAYGPKPHESITYFKTFSVSDFVQDYNSYKGNAYGLANTLEANRHFEALLPEQKSSEPFLHRPVYRTRPGCAAQPYQRRSGFQTSV
jgi:phytoene desaturase